MPPDAFSGNGNRTRGSEGSRRSGGRALIFSIVALSASGGAAILITRYVDSQRVITPTVKVVVAAKDLPLGTKLRPEHLSSVQWPQNARPQHMITEGAVIAGRVLLTRLVAGEPILESKLAPKDSRGGLAALIPTSMRAVAVRVDDVVGVAGFIHSEDRVDVIVTMRPPKQDAEPTAKVILQNVKVLAVGKDLDSQDSTRGRATSATVATLLVDPEQAEKLALAATQGQILLTLRNWADDDAISTGGMVPSRLLADVTPAIPRDAPRPGTAAAHRKRTVEVEVPPPPVVPPPPAERAKEVVEIVRGDRFEQRKFEPKEDK